MQNTFSVHTVETNVSTSNVPLYRNTLLKHCRTEFTATDELYNHFDQIEGKDRRRALLECRTRAWFVRNREDGSVRVASNSCRLRWCPLCSSARKNYIRHQVQDWFQTADYPKFLTLTVKHSTLDLTNQINHIYSAWRKLRRAKFFKDNCSGGIWFFQICWNPNRHEWHPHLHCIVTGKYMDYKRLRQLWFFYTQDSQVLDIRPIRDPKVVGDYVARYAARPSDLAHLPAKQSIELISSLFGRRISGAWGTGRGISFRPSKIPDPENWEYLGNWRIIHHLSSYDDRAKAILNAYYNKNGLGSGNSCYDYEVFMDGEGTIPAKELRVDPSPQLPLFPP